MKPIYFDNAATSWPKPDVMMQAMIDFNNGVGANPGRSGHRLSVEASRIIFNTRETIASIIGADDPDTVIFTRNATEGLNTILRGFLKPGDHVVTSSMEHNSVMRPLRALELDGIELSIARCSSAGDILPDDILASIKDNTRMIIVTHASNVTGTITPIADISDIASKYGVVLVVDAAQTVGSVAIDVMDSGVDILVFTGHKSLYGPQGTGGFYIRRGLEMSIAPLERGGTGSRSEFEEQPEFMPDRFESGTPNTIGIAGLGATARHISDIGIDKIHNKEINLMKMFVDGISTIGGIKVYGNPDTTMRTPLVSFNIDGMMPSDISYYLDERFNILSRPGLHCAPSAHRTLGTFPYGTVRFSFGMFTTEEEIEASVKAIKTISNGKRKLR
ncbi:MAG TPA: aminotransferase class V-fold PLP-dependent enzyme [Syntrophorhabdaceae bacterium]|jgi:cysteine desulfurase family protein|nr:aminotransferase class V-fold PLP-dependent enzyme [Syntrophorhabdaceae bacterium]HOF56936.1 aminotransferase class V-fold PLP-dependent enzyme [Syntrophorhabdaceae bacterium]HPL40101.1 aminotransferase class V-fold PLP-dependent enzyme [Syntrophorhabdaceae bacterium]